MHDLLDQIDAALTADLYYVALFTSLAIPDICGALQAPDAVATGLRYADWFDQWVAPKYISAGSPSLSGSQCYAFRNAMLHQGKLQPDKHVRYSRLFFIEPGPTTQGILMHNNIMADALNIDVRVFCKDIVHSARAWLEQIQGTEPYETNATSSVRRHPNGLPPYVVGFPIIG